MGSSIEGLEVPKEDVIEKDPELEVSLLYLAPSLIWF